MSGIIQVILWLLAALAVVAFFGMTVFVHELGHFLAARLFGLRADTFSIGFGHAIWSRKVGETVYKIGWIPFGGYVALPQLDPTGMATVQGDNTPEGEEGDRKLAPALWWQRIAVSIAGPLGNVLFAIMLAYLLAALPPVEAVPGLRLDGVVIGKVQEGSDAEKAGLRSGDEVLLLGGTRINTWDEFVTECHLASGTKEKQLDILVSNRVDGKILSTVVPLTRDEDSTYYSIAGLESARICAFGAIVDASPAAAAGLQTNDLAIAVNGATIYGSEDLVEAIKASGGAPLAVRVLRQTEYLDVSITPRFNEEAGTWQIGAMLHNLDPKLPMWMQHRSPMKQIKGDFQAVGRVLQALVAPKRKGESRKVAGALSGPIVILATLWLNTMANILYTIGFMRFLNINLAIINLLPLPVLDGGHIMFALYEGITRRKVNPKVLNILVNGFAILLLALFLLISVRDTFVLGRIFGRGRNVKEAEPAVELVEPAKK